MSDVTIRNAVPADEPALADLNRRVWSPISDVIPRPAPEATFFADPADAEFYLVAELDARVVGYLRLVQPIPLPSGAHVRQIQGLAVDETVRRRGIARALLDEACAEARRQGGTRLTLRVLSTNATARRLYEREGFVVEGVLRNEFRIAGRYVDDIVMARSL
ncbi:GNAT family N-acetyltransferase [Nocardia sp. NPDC051570]|uniref:GNAT family N-acetyltransferase n=1 Tax=Nocardia sp. NPDC051570 TaxID=3364324 RepID=UPI0037A5C5F4